MRNVLVLPLLASLLVLALPLRAQDEAAKRSSLWMRQKLAASQAVPKGLSAGDLDEVSKNATAMLLVEYLEKWVRADTPGYRTQLELFAFANRELIRAAREKNLDGATLAYNGLVVSCVNCHKIVRAVPR
jgi:hypothetical protein